MNSALKFILIAAITAVIISAGCVDNTVYPDIKPEMNGLLDKYIGVMTVLEETVTDELNETAEKLSSVEIGSDEALEIIRLAYSDLTHSSAVIFYDETTDEMMTVPTSNAKFGKEIISAGNSDKNKIIMHNPVSSELFGEIISISAPVYNPDGTYRGRIAAIFRANELANFAVAEIPELKGYYISVVSKDDTVIYSPQKYRIGTKFDRSAVKIEKDTDNSGKYYTKIVNSLNHEETPLSAVWKSEPMFDTVINYAVGTYIDNTDYSVLLDPSLSVTDLTNYVDSLYYYAITHTKQETIDYINKLEGISTASIYPAFAVSYDEKILAMAEHPEYIGYDMDNIDDPYGIREFKEMTLRALQGGGYVHFFIDTSMESVSSEGILSLAYVVPIGKDYYIGAEIPILPGVSKINTALVSSLNEKNSEILKYVYTHDKRDTIAAINDPKYFGNDDIKIYAVSYEGICLAYNVKPELIGTDMLGITNSHGDSTIREMLLTAKDGGGYMYYCMKESDGSTNLYLCYIQPVENSWLLCTAELVDQNIEVKL